MKIDFVKEYDSANPNENIFRIYDFRSEEVNEFITIFGELTEGKQHEIDMGDYSFIHSVGGVHLLLKIESIDRGIEQTSGSDFVCTLTTDGWKNAVDLAQPFTKSDDLNGFQWLYDLDSRIELLLLKNGKW